LLSSRPAVFGIARADFRACCFGLRQGDAGIVCRQDQDGAASHMAAWLERRAERDVAAPGVLDDLGDGHAGDLRQLVRTAACEGGADIELGRCCAGHLATHMAGIATVLRFCGVIDLGPGRLRLLIWLIRFLIERMCRC
jgi:hypothetical protein